MENGPPQGPIKGDLYTFSGPQAAEQGKHVPEVGLELHSLPRKHWTPPETCGIRAGPTHIRPDPKHDVCTLYTLPFCILVRPLARHELPVLSPAGP